MTPEFRAFAESRGLVGADLETMWAVVKSRHPEEIQRGFGSDATRLVWALIAYAAEVEKG